MIKAVSKVEIHFSYIRACLSIKQAPNRLSKIQPSGQSIHPQIQPMGEAYGCPHYLSCYLKQVVPSPNIKIPPHGAPFPFPAGPSLPA